MADANNKAIMFDGDAYEKNYGQWSRAVAQKFVSWLDLSKGLRWLDVGCGTGAASSIILAEASPAEIIGIDPSESQVSYATEQVLGARACFQVGNAMSLDFKDGEFDVALSAIVLNLVPDAVQAIREMTRVVRPSGIVATYIWDIAHDGHPASPLVNGFTRLDPNAPRFGGGGRSVESEQGVLQLFEDAGLSNLSTKKIEISVRHPSFDAYWDDALISQGPPGAYLKRMSSEELDKLKTVMIETVPTDNLGEVEYPASAWAIRGTVQ